MPSPEAVAHRLADERVEEAVVLWRVRLWGGRQRRLWRGALGAGLDLLELALRLLGLLALAAGLGGGDGDLLGRAVLLPLLAEALLLGSARLARLGAQLLPLLGALAVARPRAGEARREAAHGALGAVQRGLDVAVPHEEGDDDDGDRQHDEGADRPDEAFDPSRHARAQRAAPEVERRVHARVDPAEEAGEEEGAREGEAGEERQEDRRLLAQHHVAPREEDAEQQQDREAQQVRHERLRDDGADGPEEVLGAVVAGLHQRVDALARQDGVVGAAVRDDGEREEQRERHQHEPEDLELPLARRGARGLRLGLRLGRALAWGAHRAGGGGDGGR